MFTKELTLPVPTLVNKRAAIVGGDVTGDAVVGLVVGEDVTGATEGADVTGDAEGEAVGKDDTGADVGLRTQQPFTQSS